MQKMQDRQQGGVADQSRFDHLAQPGLAGRAQLPVQGWDAGGEVNQGTFGGGERVAATGFLQSRFDEKALRRELAAARAEPEHGPESRPHGHPSTPYRSMRRNRAKVSCSYNYVNSELRIVLSHSRDYRSVTKQMVGENTCQHCFAHGDGADADARIVPAFGEDLDILASGADAAHGGED